MILKDEAGQNQVWSGTRALDYRNQYRASLISRVIFEAQKKDILELGPGLGHLTQKLIQGDNQIYVVEKSHAFFLALENHYQTQQNLSLAHEDALTFLKQTGNQYDFIVGIGILHHLWHDPSWPQLLARKLKPIGSLVFLEPNPNNILAQFIFNTRLGRRLCSLEPKESLKSISAIHKSLSHDFCGLKLMHYDFNYPLFSLRLMKRLTQNEDKIPYPIRRYVSQSILIKASLKQLG